MSTSITIHADDPTVDVAAADMIASKISEFAHSGRPIFTNDDDYLGAPYSESFYDNCITFWAEAGYDESQVLEVVEASVEELRRAFAN